MKFAYRTVSSDALQLITGRLFLDTHLMALHDHWDIMKTGGVVERVQAGHRPVRLRKSMGKNKLNNKEERF